MPAGAPSDAATSKSDVLEDLRSKVQELAEPGRGNMSQIIAALATRLGLDAAELQSFAATWSRMKPFAKGFEQAQAPGSEG